MRVRTRTAGIRPAIIQLQFVYGFIYMFGWLTLTIFGMLYRIVPTHVSKFLTAKGVAATDGVRRVFVDPVLQLLVLITLVVGLVLASTGVLITNVALFRFGWATWLTGLLGFIVGLVRLGIELPKILRSRLAA